MSQEEETKSSESGLGLGGTPSSGGSGKKRKHDEVDEDEDDEDGGGVSLSALADEVESSSEDSDDDDDDETKSVAISPVSVRAESDVDDIGFDSDDEEGKDSGSRLFNMEAQRWNDQRLYPPGFKRIGTDLLTAFHDVPTTDAKCIDLARLNMKRVTDVMRSAGATAPCTLVKDPDTKQQWILKSGVNQWPVKLRTSEAASSTSLQALEERLGKLEKTLNAVVTKVRKVDFGDVKSQKQQQKKASGETRTAILKALVDDELWTWTKKNIKDLTPKMFLDKTKLDVSKTTLKRVLGEFKEHIASADSDGEETESDEEVAAGAGAGSGSGAAAPTVVVPIVTAAATASPSPTEVKASDL